MTSKQIAADVLTKTSIKKTGFTQTRSCKNCGHVDTAELSKREAAFEELRNNQLSWHTPCSQCGSKKSARISNPSIVYDVSIMDEWGINKDLHFFAQDEEIIIAELENLEWILHGLKNDNNYLYFKKYTLLEALCILLYDFTYEDEDFSDEEEQVRKENAAIVLPELQKRKFQIKNIGNRMLDYVKEVVFPQIGI